MKIIVVKREHPLYRINNYINAEILRLIGRYHYIYSSSKGTISLISIYLLSDKYDKIWEAYGYHIENPIIFHSKKGAEKLIYGLLK